MTVIDLSHTLTTDMPVYPGTPSPNIRSRATFERDGFRERQLPLSPHTRTHRDAANATDFPVHRTLLENDIPIIENLARPHRLLLPLADADDAPTRVVAILETRSKEMTP